MAKRAKSQQNHSVGQITSAIGLRLGNARRGTGKSQLELASELQIVPAYVSLIENGHRQPTLLVLFKWAGACGVLVEHLLAGLEAELEYERGRR